MTTTPKRQCRVCALTKSAESQMVRLFGRTKNNGNLADMFVACSTVTLEPNDRLPQLICHLCRERLEAAYNFQKQCIKTDQEMRAQLYRTDDEAYAIKTAVKEEGQQQTGTLSQQTIETVLIESIDIKIEEYTKLEPGEDAEPTVIVKEYDSPTETEYLPPTIADEANVFQTDTDDSEDNLPLNNLIKANKKRRPGRPAIKSKKCPICNIEFDRPSRLQRHLMVHNEVARPHKCPTCKHGFVNEGKLYRHMLKHSDLMADIAAEEAAHEYKCPACDRQFNKKLSLAGHMRVHALQRPHTDGYACKACDEKFTDLMQLTKHERGHVKREKSFECNLCSMTFMTKGRLVDHLLNHSGLKPYVCPYCNKGLCVGQSIHCDILHSDGQ